LSATFERLPVGTIDGNPAWATPSSTELPNASQRLSLIRNDTPSVQPVADMFELLVFRTLYCSKSLMSDY
jgi:hypothetical protein